MLAGLQLLAPSSNGSSGKSKSLEWATAPGTCTTCRDITCSPTTGFVASAWGDPHLTTHDNLKYDFQGFGEYILAIDPADPNFVLQTRTAPYAGSTLVTVTIALAAQVGTDRIVASVDGGSVDLTSNGFALTVPSTRTLLLPGGGIVANDPPSVGTNGNIPQQYVITWPTGEVLSVSAYVLNSPFLGFKFYLGERPRHLQGLLGSPDGNPNNDIQARDGTIIAQPPSFSDLYNVFGNSWRISQAESRFDYGPGQSTATFTNTAFPMAPISLTAAQQAAATTACQAAGVTDQVTLAACVTDVGSTGDPAFAQGAVVNASPAQAGEVDITSPSGVTTRITQGTPGPPAQVGCSDGQREGLIDPVAYPHIAGCLGSWTGGKSFRAATTGAACGDDVGACAVPADICAAGWHICGVSGDPAELLRLTTSACENAGGGAYMAAVSYCLEATGACTYAASKTEPYACTASGTCSESVCCGAACSGYGVCTDAVWTGHTHTIADGDGCGAAHARTAGGVLCCDNGGSAVGTGLCAGVPMDDGNPCTRDSCDPVVGATHIPIPGQACGTNTNVCNGQSTCDSTGTCQPGTPLQVDDGNPCTIDTCDPVTGVHHTPNPAGNCSDNNVCNGLEVCTAAGICQPGTPLQVDDGNACTIDSCNSIAGVSHTPVGIDDGNPCTSDACNPATGVSHTPLASAASCSTSNPCDGVRVCNATAECLTVSAPNLNDGNACTVDSCSDIGGVAVPQHTPIPGCIASAAHLAAGAANVTELRSDGTLAFWGDGTYGEQLFDSPLRFSSISAAANHVCGVETNGTALCWGENNGSWPVFAPGNAYTKVSTSADSTCALALDGTLSCWGATASSGFDTSKSFQQLSVGSDIVCVLDASGTPQCWGNISGTPTSGGFTQIAVGSFAACAIGAGQLVTCWGNDGWVNNALPATTPFSQIMIGNGLGCGVTTAGALVCWGQPAYPQYAAPTSGTFTQVTFGADHACAVRSDSTVQCWGTNTSGQAPSYLAPLDLVAATVGVPYSTSFTFGLPYVGPSGTVAVSTGALPAGLSLTSSGALSGAPSSAGLASFSVRYTDSNGFLQTQAYTLNVHVPSSNGASCLLASDCASGSCVSGQCCTGAGCTRVTEGADHTCILKPDGSVGCWGDTTHGATTAPTGTAFTSLAATQEGTCGISATEQVTCWGNVGFYGPTVPSGPLLAIAPYAGNSVPCGLGADGTAICYQGARPLPNTELTSISESSDVVCGIKPDGHVSCAWEDSGALFPTTPTDVTFTSVAVGQWNGPGVCGVRSDGALVCWSPYEVPAPPTDVLFTSVELTANGVGCGLTTTGAIRCFGRGAFTEPTYPPGTFVQLSLSTTDTTGAYHGCAIRTDGTVGCFGDNSFGESPTAFVPSNVVNGTDQVAYSQTLTFGAPYVGPNPKFIVSSGSLPPGVTLSPAGVLSGTPEGVGSYAFAVRYSDDNKLTGSQSYTLVIAGPATDGTSCNTGSQCASGSCMSGVCCTGAACFGVSAGGSHTCELQSNGTVSCWGDDSLHQCEPPAGASFLQVSAGLTHTCGVKTDHTVVCWGDPSWNDLVVPTYSDFVQVTSGDQQSCGVRASGAVVCWGAVAANGATDIPGTATEVYSQASLDLIRTYGCALRADGHVECTGYNPASSPTTSFTQVAIGSYYACGLGTDGTVTCWGNIAAAPTDAKFRQISAGPVAVCGVTTTGAIECWGSNSSGQLTTPSGTFTHISVGGSHACADRSDGAVLCWGSNASGQAPAIIVPTALPNGLEGAAYSQTLQFGPPYSAPGAHFTVSSGTLPPGLALSSGGVLAGTPTAGGSFGFTIGYTDANAIVAMQLYTLLVSGTNEVDGQPCSLAPQCVSGVCVRGTCGGIDVPDGGSCTDPTQCSSGICALGLCSDNANIPISAGSAHTCVLNAVGNPICWGYNFAGDVSTTPTTDTFEKIVLDSGTTCGLHFDGTARCWGNDFWGNTNIPSTDQFLQFSGGQETNCGILVGGSIACWGQFAGGVPTYPAVFSQVSTGWGVNCALDPTGAAQCWQGATAVPPGVYKSLSASYGFACGIRSDDTAICWGSEDGSGRTTPPPTATFLTIGTGEEFGCGLTPAQTITCWGQSSDGKTTPPPGTFSQLAVGHFHACAVTTAGVIECWGNNSYGQLNGIPGN